MLLIIEILKIVSVWYDPKSGISIDWRYVISYHSTMTFRVC